MDPWTRRPGAAPAVPTVAPSEPAIFPAPRLLSFPSPGHEAGLPDWPGARGPPPLRPTSPIFQPRLPSSDPLAHVRLSSLTLEDIKLYSRLYLSEVDRQHLIAFLQTLQSFPSFHGHF